MSSSLNLGASQESPLLSTDPYSPSSLNTHSSQRHTRRSVSRDEKENHDLCSYSLTSRTWMILGVFSLFLAAGLFAFTIHLMRASMIDHYGLMVDAGSSHTKLQIYRWKHHEETNGHIPLIYMDHIGQVVSTFEQKIPLHSFIGKEDEIRPFLRSFLDYVDQHVPSHYHMNTPFFMFATAGMRKFSLEQQNKLYDAIKKYLRANSRLLVRDSFARTISEQEEGVFGWMTVNFLLGHFSSKTKPSVGALDMGGSSLQITFEPEHVASLHSFNLTVGGRRYSLYTHSFQFFGIDAFESRYNQLLIDQQQSTPTELIPSPCLPLNYTETVDEHTLVGSSQFTSCSSNISILLNFSVPCELLPCSFNGIYQPPINGEFVGFSNFWRSALFFDLDVSHTSSVYISDLINRTKAFCALSWEDAKRLHPEMHVKYLPWFCLRGIQLSSLLVEGFGFPETGDVDISFTDALTSIPTEDKQTVELGWSLGGMLYEELYSPFGDTGIHDPKVSINLAIFFFILGGVSLLVGLFTLYKGICLSVPYSNNDDDVTRKHLFRNEKSSLKDLLKIRCIITRIKMWGMNSWRLNNIGFSVVNACL